MAKRISADKETVYRGTFDEYGVVRVRRVITITDDEGNSAEHVRTVTIRPGDDVSGYPQPLQDLVAAARYPAALQRWAVQGG